MKSVQFSLDELDEFKTLTLAIDGKQVSVYISTYRDMDIKVIKFSDIFSMLIWIMSV